MRKFAMTLLLGLGMATASFAGGVETEGSKAAPKGCFVYESPCGTRLLCAQSLPGDGMMRTLMIIEAIDDC